METMTEPKRGTASPVPKPETPNWVTPEEAERCEETLGKNFVRKKEKKEGETKEFFYQVVGVNPYHELAGKDRPSPNTLQHLVNFQVLKFYRNKKEDRKSIVGGIERAIKVNSQVQWVEYDKLGNARVLDADASFDMDSRKFFDEFKPDV